MPNMSHIICDEKYKSTGARIPCKLKCSHIFCRKCALDWIKAKVSLILKPSFINPEHFTCIH